MPTMRNDNRRAGGGTWVRRTDIGPAKGKDVLAIVEVEGIHKRMIVRRLPTAGYWNDQYGGLVDSQVVWWLPMPDMPEEDPNAD